MFNWITDRAWEETQKWIYEKLLDAINSFVNIMNNMGAELFSLSWIQAIILFFKYFGWALYVVGLIIAVFDTAIEAQSGKADFKGTAINALKGFFAVNLFTIVPIELYKFCISLQGTLTNSISGMIGGANSIQTSAQEALTAFTGTQGLFYILLLIATAYCIIKIFMQNIKRGGIMLIQIAVGSLYMFSIPRGTSDGFIQWSKRIIGICFTAFMQSTLLIAGLITFKNNMLLGLGIMLAANEVERVAEGFGLDTSTRGNMGGAIHATSAAINVFRTIKR